MSGQMSRPEPWPRRRSRCSVGAAPVSGSGPVSGGVAARSPRWSQRVGYRVRVGGQEALSHRERHPNHHRAGQGQFAFRHRSPGGAYPVRYALPDDSWAVELSEAVPAPPGADAATSAWCPTRSCAGSWSRWRPGGTLPHRVRVVRVRRRGRMVRRPPATADPGGGANWSCPRGRSQCPGPSPAAESLSLLRSRHDVVGAFCPCC